jgi:predicted metal-dependent phosphoesterase TrpH
MPAGQPFTALCRHAAASPATGRVDLHLHTTYSDGLYTPRQVVDIARRSGLSAIALTDHDTMGGLAEAQAASLGADLEVVCGVEISAELDGRELHLLGYFCDSEYKPLLDALERLARHRADRFNEMVERLRVCGVEFADAELPATVGAETLGRRHLAELLVKTRRAGTVREAFLRYLSDGGKIAVPKACLPVREAIALVRASGGAAGWAHPSYDCTEDSLRRLRDMGLGALEVVYPAHRASRERQLRDLANRLELAVTGGSDCHGPEPAGRCIGTCTIHRSELEVLRRATSG